MFATFLYPVHLMPLWFPVEFRGCIRAQKTRMLLLPECEESWTMCSFILTVPDFFSSPLVFLNVYLEITLNV